MSESNNGKGNILCVGFIVLVFVSLVLFWSRFYCKVAIGEVADFPRIAIELSGLVDVAIENDPNTVPSGVSYGGYRDETMSYSLGVYDYCMKKSRYAGATENYFYQHYAGRNEMSYVVYYDKRLRQFVYCDMNFKGGNKNQWIKKIQYYVGPDGVAKDKDDTIGQFVRPVKVSLRYRGRVFYDEGLRRFFRLDFRGKRQITKEDPDGRIIKEWVDREISVFMGKPLAEDTWRRPVGSSQMNGGFDMYWWPPDKRIIEDKSKDSNERGRHNKSVPIDVGIYAWSHKFIPVVDATGRIDLLDRDTLEFVGGMAGKLPAAPEFYGLQAPGNGGVRPKDLYGFKIIVFSDPNNGEYKGIAVGSSARDLSGTALLIYDAKGRCISHASSRWKYERVRHKTDSGHKYVTLKKTDEERSVMKVAWGPVLVLSKFALESMQGLVFQAGSLVTDAFGPRSWGRALFFIPDSFLAGRERINMENYLEKYVILFFMLIPPMAISILLGWCVGKNAKAIGLADSARMWWIIATIAFGLSAYITYRFVRPKIALVTCAGCGKLRRPDLEECHHCRSSWQAASPNKPLWRVID